MNDPVDVEVLVVGAGFSGIGAAIKLGEAGITDWMIVEAGDGAGGTWHWNTYPGVAVDIPSFSYQFSFAQRRTWSRSYAPGSELKAYAEWLIDRYRLRPRIRFGTTVTRARFDSSVDRWRIETGDGTPITARFLFNASGVLTTPKAPDIDGIADFAGTTVHTSRWDHAVDLTGKRVGVIGTGASAVQLIPAVADRVGTLSVFQRTPIWCFPKPDVSLPGPLRRLLGVPGAASAVRAASQALVEITFPIAAHYHRRLHLATMLERAGRWWLRRQVRDPQTRAALTPAYGLGCKRPSFHNAYLSTYNQDHVHLITDAITKVTPDGITTADGQHYPLDVLVLATGFKVMERDNIPTYELIGANDRSLADYWGENRLQAYEGVAIPGYPNFFTVFGPYGYNGSSYFALIEAQVHHIVRCLREARHRNATRVEVTPEANERYFGEMMRRRVNQVFWQQSCTGSNSYYFDDNGDVGLRPTTTLESATRSRRFDLDDYRYTALERDLRPVSNGASTDPAPGTVTR